MTGQEAADWIEIHQLKSKYSWYYDTPEFEKLMELFTEDAVLVMGPYGTCTNREEIRAMFAENISAPDNNFPTLHATTNPLIEIDGDTATGRWFLLDTVLNDSPTKPTLGWAAVYYEEYRREQGRWLISRVEMRFLWSRDFGRVVGDAPPKLNFHADSGGGLMLEGKRMIVTGGASGIAAATVRAYAREGASVVSLDINDAAGEAIAHHADQLGSGPITYAHCDVTNEAEVTSVFASAIAHLGGLDALASIAGIEQQVPGEDVTEADIDLMIGVHLKGTIFTNQAAFRAMAATGGSIINYSSFAGVRGFPGMPTYGAAKAAILGWTRIVAQDWGSKGIRVNAVCPAVMTELAEAWLAEMDPGRRAMVDESLRRTIPLGGKLGAPEDAANLNVFLASDSSSFITGQTLPVDGGQMMVG